MVKTYLYIPEQLDEQISRAVKAQKKSKAEVLRTAIQEGLDAMKKQKTGGAETLLKLAEISKKANFKGPRDGSINHDYYLWGLPKKNPTIKP